MGMSEFYGTSDDTESINTLHKAIDLGVNFFDTADMYASGANEKLIGKAFQGKWNDVVLADLARSSHLDYQALWWIANNHFNDKNVKKSNNIVVNFLHKQWLSEYWGDGTLSSSDGQRFPTSGKIRNATSIVKYFGFGKGVTFILIPLTSILNMVQR